MFLILKEVKDMAYMPEFCRVLSVISNFNNSKVINMKSMFEDCNAITVLNLKNFDTSEITNFANIFSSVSRVSYLDISNFNTKKVQDMNSMLK